jgi:hypothetical protein
MAVRSTTRPLWRLPLVLFLSAPILSVAAPTAERERAIEFAILRAASPAVLMTLAGSFSGHARQRSAAPSPFTLLPSENVASDPGYHVAVIDAEPRDPLGFRRHLIDALLRSIDCSFDRNAIPGDPIR